MLLQAQVPTSAEPGTEAKLEDSLAAFFAPYAVDDLHCPVCGKKCTFMATKKFKTFPKYLVVVLLRFVLHNWVPKKLDVDFKFDTEMIRDFNHLLGKGPQENEKIMPEVAA